MKIKTTRFDEIDIPEEDIIKIPQGLVGFPEFNRFAILEHDKDSPFKWFQSLDDGSMAFVIISPLIFNSNYMVEASEEEISDLEIKDPDDAVISVIVTIPDDPQKMSANLKAPIIFNLKNKIGKQLILKDPKYQTKHYIIEEMKKHSKESLENAPRTAATQDKEKKAIKESNAS